MMMALNDRYHPIHETSFNSAMSIPFLGETPQLQEVPPLMLENEPIPPKRREELRDTLARQFDIAFTEDDEERGLTCGDLFWLVEEKLDAAGRLPEPCPGESADELYPLILEKIKLTIAGETGITPQEVGSHAEFRDLIPRRQRRRTYQAIYRELGNDQPLSMSRFGCSVTILLIFAAISATITWLSTLDIPIRFSFWVSVPIFFVLIFLCDKLLANCCDFPYRTLDELARARSAAVASEMQRWELERRFAELLVAFFEIPEEDRPGGVRLSGYRGAPSLEFVRRPYGSCDSKHQEHCGHCH